MFFAVEGGGFFSASATGYSKGLSLLLLVHKSDEKHMRVAPWNQYQLVDQESKSDPQLASGKHRHSRGCASLVCFGCASAGLESKSPLKVGPSQSQDILASISSIERDEKLCAIVDNDISAVHIALKSSMKRSLQKNPPTNIINGEHEPLIGEGSTLEGLKEKRKVQWSDACGEELTEVREFEQSERGESDDEFGNGNKRTCACRIM